jgi:hypothetical protein
MRTVWIVRRVLTWVIPVMLLACGSKSASDTRQSDFTSLKPGSTGDQKAGSAETAAPDNSGNTVKIEDSDVVRMDGTKLYILNAFRGLQAVDVADPQAPKLLSRVAVQGTPREMYVANGLATVLLSEHYAFSATSPGQMQSTIGSQVQVIDLANPAALQTTASIDLPGWVVASRRIDNRLIVVTADVGQTPWWGWCWGPYACMAEAGVASSGSGSSTSSVASPAGMWWPWGGNGYGAWASSGRVSVIDQADAKNPKLLGSVQFAGGAAVAVIQPGEVIVLGSEWQTVDNVAQRTDRTQQIAIAADGSVKIAASDAQTLKGNDVWYAGLRSATGLGAGEIAVTSSTYQGGTDLKVGVQVQHRKVAAGQWSDLGTWQASAPQGWWDVRFDGKTALVSEGGWQSKTGAAMATTLHVLDLTNAPTETASLVVPGSTQPVLATSLNQTQPGLWLLSGVVADVTGASQTTLRTLSLADVKKPQLLGLATIDGGYAWWGAGTELLENAGVVLAAVQGADGKSLSSLQIVSFDAKGKLTPHGTFGSNLVSWWQLRSLAAGNKLWRIGNQALESVDIANFDQPKPLATLELAAHVSALASVSGRVVALVADWQNNTAQLRTLQKEATDEGHFDAKLTVPEAWGRLTVVGNIVWFIGSQSVRAYDFADPLQPKARGTWTTNGENGLWYNVSGAVLHGNALWLVGQKSSVLYGDSDACGSPSTDASSTEPGKPGTDVPPNPANDADSTTDMDAGTPADGDGKTDYDAGIPEQKCIVSWLYTTTITALDLSNPDQPAPNGTVNLPDAAWAWGAQVTGDTLWLTHYESAAGVDGTWYGKYYLDRVNVADVSAPTVASKVNVPGWIVGFAADGSQAYALDWQPKAGTQPQDGQIESLLDVLSLEGDKAFLTSQTTLPGSAGAALVNGAAVYISAWQYPWLAKGGTSAAAQTQLFVVDVSAPDAATVAQTLNPGAPIGAMSVHGKTLLATIGWGAGVQTWNVTDPLAPQFLGFTSVQGQPYDVLEVANALWLPMGWMGIDVIAP